MIGRIFGLGSAPKKVSDRSLSRQFGDGLLLLYCKYFVPGHAIPGRNPIASTVEATPGASKLNNAVFIDV